MRRLKNLLKAIPCVPFLYSLLLKGVQCARSMSTEKIFSEIYHKNHWGSDESVSGTGSVLNQTAMIARELPRLLEELEAGTMLDIPCGDFNWMQQVNLRGIDYLGADIVSELVLKNRESYGSSSVRFEHLNLLEDDLPTVDVIFCRDCLVHLSFQDIRRALQNISRSQSKFLLVTTFVKHPKNVDIATGQWRPINLQMPPFNFPDPIRVISENCSEGAGAYQDKVLALWAIADISAAAE
jgi:SAM-dependent methyltransferase